MEQAQKLRLSNAFEERVKSLLDDHYCLRVKTRLSNIWIARLHHMANGNDIVIKAYPKQMILEQFTNKVCTHREQLQSSLDNDIDSVMDYLFSRP